MKDLGANAYRFSISWPRIFPDGTGQPNQKGLDFYSRLVDELKAAGIESFATLYYWDLPQALQDRYGGWQSAETAKAFGEYGAHVSKSLGDRVPLAACHKSLPLARFWNTFQCAAFTGGRAAWSVSE